VLTAGPGPDLTIGLPGQRRRAAWRALDSGHTGSSSMREALGPAGERIFTAITGQR